MKQHLLLFSIMQIFLVQCSQKQEQKINPNQFEIRNSSPAAEKISSEKTALHKNFPFTRTFFIPPDDDQMNPVSGRYYKDESNDIQVLW